MFILWYVLWGPQSYHMLSVILRMAYITRVWFLCEFLWRACNLLWNRLISFEL